ncbi:auxin-responsive protein IAA27-like [Miscanthus floridulus]|uniref:auxin-responsive protein IAA27-like n=1 Tax=Miscanthus floridulus TaxID=154761 RepID=UPI00345A145F
MLNLVSFETPPLGRQERSANTTITATATAAIRGKEESSSNTCFHGHLDLSLGISLSHGGGGGCDASSCDGSKESYGGRQGSRDDKDNIRFMNSGTTTANVITAGHRHHVGDLTASSGSGGGGWATAFMPSLTGFMHPWSLAARQQAAAEQDRTPPTTYMSSDDRVATSPSAVGWPPVHTTRRNIVTAMQVTKTGATAADGPESTTTTHAAAGGEKNVAAPPMTDSTVVATLRPAPANMFAKVHMEGYAIGRKINLRAQGGYDSLSRVLTNMTTNFFCPADCSGAGTAEKDAPNSDKFIFLYEDFEGDRMLVGDVPWELFLASAKRLYIVRNPAQSDKGQGEGDRKYKTKEPTND